MNCSKRKLSKVDSMLALVETQHKRHRQQVKEQRFYFCKYCNAYHLTSKELKEKPTK